MKAGFRKKLLNSTKVGWNKDWIRIHKTYYW